MSEQNQSQGQTKKCPKCGELIQATAKKCKHCQSDLRNWFARHKVLTGIIGVIILIIVLISSGEEEEMKAGTQELTNNTQSETQEPAKNIKSKTQFISKALGEEIITKTYKFKINSADEKKSISGGWGNPQPASEGAKFVVINMNVTNLADEKSTFFPDGMINLVDDQGKKFETYEDTITNIENYLNVRDLSPGIIEKGVLVYEIPESILIYDLFIQNEGTKEIYQVKLK